MSDATYAHCAQLTRDQWAWEFLRRNPDYRQDYLAFIAIWRALEADYGVPPERDFHRWKQDPRAYGPLPGDDELNAACGELCSVDDDRVLLECWMGAKWGFYKFPLDPERPTPPGADDLTWRPPPPASSRPIGDPYRVDLAFDLSLPLPPQLETARLRLARHTADLRRQGLAAPVTVANQRARWTRMLQLLDADSAGRTTDEHDATLLREAQATMRQGYLDILRLGET
jgi:hypothetical protein